MRDWIVQTDRLCKTYRGTSALKDCDLRVARGAIFGLLGPNGAGKTTLLRLLLGFIRPTSGSATVHGLDCVRHSLQVRRQISYLPGDARLFRTMRGAQVLRLFSGLQARGSYAASRSIAARLDLDLARRVMFMSTGMRQKLALAVVLGSQAPVVILDEPTANLDPNVRAEVLSIVRETRSECRTVIMSSHIFSDIEEVCDEVAIMQAGRVVATELVSQLKQVHIVRGQAAAHADTEALSKPHFVQFVEASGGEVELHLSGRPNEWLGWLSELQLENLRIDSAGVRAVYERFHRPTPKAGGETRPSTPSDDSVRRAEPSTP